LKCIEKILKIDRKSINFNYIYDFYDPIVFIVIFDLHFQFCICQSHLTLSILILLAKLNLPAIYIYELFQLKVTFEIHFSYYLYDHSFEKFITSLLRYANEVDKACRFSEFIVTLTSIFLKTEHNLKCN